MTRKVKKHGWNICGSKIKFAREQKKLSQFQVAVELSSRVGELKGEEYPVSRSSITEIEGGTRFVKEFEVLILAQILEVDVRWLLGLDD